jgi:hypothetical protein
MIPGLAYNITCWPQRPAQKLQLLFESNHSGLHFQPSSLNFSEYYALPLHVQVFATEELAASQVLVTISNLEPGVPVFAWVPPFAISISPLSQRSTPLTLPNSYTQSPDGSFLFKMPISQPSVFPHWLVL